MSIEKLVKLSNFYGANGELVLAGGGNTSYKTDDTLFVKGSGVSLASIDENGFVKMSRQALDDIFKKEYKGQTHDIEAEVLKDMLAARLAGEEAKRPSVEALLHNLFPQSYVLHLHPAMVNGITCAKDGEAITNQLFAEKASFMAEEKPGFTLAKGAKGIIDDYKAKTGSPLQILILQNHGVFLAADTTEELDKLLNYVLDTIGSNLKQKPIFDTVEFDKKRAALIAPALRMLFDNSGLSVCTHRINSEIKSLVETKEVFKPLSSAYTPDHIVYYGHEPLFIEYKENLEEQYNEISRQYEAYISKNGIKPKLVAVEKIGIYAFGKSKKEADIAADLFFDAVKIYIYTKSFGDYRFMADDMISFIRNWEMEAYRKKVSLASSTQKRLSGKISIITGGAQGFGQGIADFMAQNGAYVVISDLNAEGAEKTSLEFNQKYGTGVSISTKTDVSDEASVENSIYDAALAYGGLDILVSNAGILKSGSLEDMDLKSFNLVTNVNYTAYFICVKYASRIMKIQHRFAPNYYADIIQINSKSGLTGSNKNFAYAGGKFGGIGLTQSFALELVEYNIKVNSICPGNFFDGPLWCDPEKGLFVQYLKAGKVKGAKTIEDVKKFYEDKVPMGRGCNPEDVAKAIYYIVEQTYETGQAIPVTGGQNMLK